MGLHLQLVNYNELVSQVPGQLMVLNDLEGVTKQDRERIEQLTTSVFNQTDIFSNEPHCECEATTGGYNLGIICPRCHTPVQEQFSKELVPRVWLRNPHGVAWLINPVVWNMLSLKFTISGFNLIEWLCNTDYVAPGSTPLEVTEEVKALGIQRGYNFFVNNFDHIIDALYSLKKFSKTRGDHLQKLITEQRECVFSTHLPLPNKALLIKEDTNVGKFMDNMLLSILNAIQMIRSIDTKTVTFSVRQKENRTVKTLVELSAFYYESYHQLFARKPGLIRRHICGTRGHWTSRAVISSNTGPHHYDELWLSWGQAVTIFSIHLKNKLFKMGYTPNESAALLYHYTNVYNPLIDNLLQELIAETPNGRGFSGIFVRNPSLSRASTERMRITQIKKDPNDQTTSLSILSVKGYNADFDGDQMSLQLMLDNHMSRAAEALAPHKNILDPNQPRNLTNVAEIPKPVASTISSWMDTPTHPSSNDPRKRAFLSELARG
jgi:hypothetical protein